MTTDTLFLLAPNEYNAAVDSSFYGRKITRTGAVSPDFDNQRNSRPSFYFDGNLSYLQVKTAKELDICAGDFTVETWVKLNGGTTNPHIFQFSSGADLNFRWNVYCPSRANFSLSSQNGYNAGAARVVSSAITDNVWYHLAVVKSGTTITLYVNGVSQGTTTDASFYAGRQILTLGTQDQNIVAGNCLKGWLQDFRVSPTAIYTANFTPPASVTALYPPNGHRTVLLMHGDGTGGNSNYVDSSEYGTDILTDGKSIISANNSVFGGTSGQFSSGSHVSLATDPGFSLDGDFTIEVSFYAVNQASYSTMVGSGVTTFASGGSYLMFLGTGNDKCRFHFGSNQINPLLKSTSFLKLNRWNSVAVTRSGTTVRMFVNGVLESTATSSLTFNFGNGGLLVGKNGWDAANGYFYGYIDELRITKGIARYTATYTLPTAQFGNSLAEDPNWASVSLLMHFDGDDGSKNFIDQTGKTVTSVDTKLGFALTTTDSVFGGSSMYFNDSYSPAQIQQSGLLNFGTRNFTFELWYKPINTTRSYQNLMCTRQSSWNTECRAFSFISSTRKVQLSTNLEGVILNSATALTLNTWYHVAFVRQDGVFKVYINGKLDALTSAFPDADLDFSVGGTNIGHSIWDGVNGYLSGYVDELSITKGAALYSSGFTVPTSPYPSTPGPLTESSAEMYAATAEALDVTPSEAKMMMAQLSTLSDGNECAARAWRIELATLSSYTLQNRRRPLIFITT